MTNDAHQHISLADAESFIAATASLIIADVQSGAIAMDSLTPDAVSAYVVRCYERHSRMLDVVGNGLHTDNAAWRAVASHLYNAIRGVAA